MAFNIKDIPAKIKQMVAGTAGGAVASGSGSRRQVYIPILGLLIFVGLAFYVIDQVRINGPLYEQLKANDDLRADILPPPLYSVDAFAAANAAFVAASNLTRLAFFQLTNQFQCRPLALHRIGGAMTFHLIAALRCGYNGALSVIIPALFRGLPTSNLV